MRRLEGLIFFFLILFAILLPHSIKGARHAWMAAGFLWLAKLAIERKRPYPQALSAPLLAYILLSAISTALSPDPYLSWPRMRVVCLVLAGIVLAQNLKRVSQIRILVLLLLLSGLAATAFTAWQYTYGVGVKAKYVAPTSDLHHAGVRTGDIITQVNGRSVHTPAATDQGGGAKPARKHASDQVLARRAVSQTGNVSHSRRISEERTWVLRTFHWLVASQAVRRARWGTTSSLRRC